MRRAYRILADLMVFLLFCIAPRGFFLRQDKANNI